MLVLTGAMLQLSPMPQGTPISAFEVQEIMARFNGHRKQGKPIMESCELVAKYTGRPVETIWAVIRRLRPTTGIASDYIRAQAFKLAHRVVAQASVEQAIDILSRPNIGVIDPIKKGESGSGGFYLSVQTGSCGAVKMGVMAGGMTPQLPGAINEQPTPNPDDEAIPIGDSISFFGRRTRTILSEGKVGRGSPFKRGDPRRPNRGRGVRKSKAGLVDQPQEPQTVDFDKDFPE